MAHPIQRKLGDRPITLNNHPLIPSDMVRKAVAVVLFLSVLTIAPLSSAGGPRVESATYASVGVAGVVLGGDGGFGVGIGGAPGWGFLFAAGETRVRVEVADITGIPIGAQWALIELDGEHIESGDYCESFTVDLPNVEGDWVIFVHLPGTTSPNTCTGLPHPAGAGTLTATFT